MVPGRTRLPHVVALAATALLAFGASTAARQEPATTSVRLTSPLGRTALAGTIRVVAQVITPALGGVIPVRFYVDGKLLAEDLDGPPYVTEWVDENPYEPREIRVDVEDGRGGIVSDRVSLTPLDVVEESHVASVLVEALVTDETGRAIASLEPNDFTLYENESRQTLDLVQLERVPTQFTLHVDASQSMHRRIDLVRATTKRLTSRLREGDMVVVAPFRRGVETLTGPTNDERTIAEAIAGIRADGGTAIRDSLATLPELFAPTQGRHVVILVTDGYDEHSVRTTDEALDGLRRLHATVYVVGIGGVAGISLKGELLLRELAKRTGGRAFFPMREEQVPDVHDAIASDVFSRYIITYTPTNQEPDGTYRAIRLLTSNETYKVRAREGYWAPKPPPVRPTLEFSAVTSVDEDTIISASDLTIVEDGVVQTIESFYEASAPMSIVLALDASGSMKPALEEVKRAAMTFVEALRPGDPLALLQFSDGVTFAHDFSTYRKVSLDTIASHKALGGTALWDGLHGAMGLLERREQARRAVVVLTDGRDENNPGTAPGSEHTLKDVLDRVAETETTVYAIGLGPNVDKEGLEQVAVRSGGAAYFPEDVADLAEQYRRVIEDLRRRYVITYTSTNPKRDGAWREVQITTSKPGVTIRSRGGYTGPESATTNASPR